MSTPFGPWVLHGGPRDGKTGAGALHLNLYFYDLTPVVDIMQQPPSSDLVGKVFHYIITRDKDAEGRTIYTYLGVG